MAMDMQCATRHINDEVSGRLKEWKAKDLVCRSKKIGKELMDRGISTSQIRNFLDEVNRIAAETRGQKADDFDSSRVVLLKPQLAYAAGRQRGDEREALTDLAYLFSAAIDKVEDGKDFKKLADFTRAIVAYHRFHGGKE